MQIEYAESSLMARVLSNFNTIDEVKVLSQDAPFSNYSYNIILQSLKQSLEEHRGESRRVVKHRLFQLYRSKTGEDISKLYRELIAYERQAELRDLEQLFMEYYTKRQAAVIGGVLVNALVDEKLAEDIVSYASNALAQLDDFNVSEATKTNKDHCEALYDELERMQNGEVTKVNLGIKQLDQIIGGVEKKQNIVIGARPSMGKTAFALTLMDHFVFDLGKKSAFISVEMEEGKLFNRLVQIRSGVNIYNASKSRGNYQSFVETAAIMGKSQNLIIRKTTDRKIGNIRSICRKLKRDNPDLEVIMVDYMQKILSNSKKENVETIEEVSGVLTDMASDLDVIMFPLAQLRRQQDPKKIPTLEGLKGASRIEEDADMVLLIHRDSRDSEEAAILVDKNRDGQTGRAIINFKTDITKFYGGDYYDESADTF
jgi:replicative DNA helicase